jgi:transposase
MNKARPLYEASYKLEVAKMVVDQGLTISQVCKDLSIESSAVARWAKQYRAEMHGLPSIGHPITPEQ